MTVYRYNAESWDEFVHDLRTRSSTWRYRESEATDSDREWSGCRDWNEAIKFAVEGHPAGRAAIDSAAVKVTMAQEPLWDVAPIGAFPCIPAYAAGVPEDMFTMSDIAPPSPSPIVRIAVNMGAIASIRSQDIVNRGVAIVSLIDRIQLSGRRVELIAFTHWGSSSTGDRYLLSVTVKRPEEPIDMHRIGLCFATPIMQRRFFFRVAEIATPTDIPGYGFSTQYDEECKQYELTVPLLTDKVSCSTPDNAVNTITRLWAAAAAA